MLTIAAQFVFVISFGGVILMIIRKVPAVLELPETASVSIKSRIFARFKKQRSAPKPDYYRARELKEKTAPAAELGKREEIDSDGDYWDEIMGG